MKWWGTFFDFMWKRRLLYTTVFNTRDCFQKQFTQFYRNVFTCDLPLTYAGSYHYDVVQLNAGIFIISNDTRVINCIVSLWYHFFKTSCPLHEYMKQYVIGVTMLEWIKGQNGCRKKIKENTEWNLIKDYVIFLLGLYHLKSKLLILRVEYIIWFNLHFNSL